MTTAQRPATLPSVPSVDRLRVKIFADGANLASMLDLYRDPRVAGFTTNPTLMRNAGIGDYRAFAHEVIDAIPDRPISFEVFSDDLDEMERQAREIEPPRVAWRLCSGLTLRTLVGRSWGRIVRAASRTQQGAAVPHFTGARRSTRHHQACDPTS
jgi:hypothetical protein